MTDREHEKTVIMATLQARLGMTPESATTLSEFNLAQADWSGQCQRCRAHLTGTLAQLREHKCVH